MVLFIELIIEFFLIHKIWVEKDKARAFMWYLSAMFLLFPSLRNGVEWPYPSVLFPIVVTIKMIAKKEFYSNLKRFPFKWILLFFLLFHLLQIHTISWMHTTRLVKMEIFAFIGTYYTIFIGFCMTPSVDQLQKNTNFIKRLFILYSFIGLICFILQNNFIASSLNPSSIWTEVREVRGFRTTGTMASPNIFGLISVYSFMMIFFLEEKTWKKSLYGILVLFNIFICATRAPFVCLIASFLVFYLGQKTSYYKYIFFIIPSIYIFSEFVIPYLSSIEYVAGIVDMFATGGEESGGSTMAMRMEQLSISWDYLLKSPIWGHGVGYTNNLVGLSGLFNDQKDVGLAGAEGYLFVVFIDYGAIFFVFVCIFFIRLFMFFMSNYLNNTKVSAFSISLLTALIIFLLTSQPRDAWNVLLPTLGVFVGILSNLKKKSVGV